MSTAPNSTSPGSQPMIPAPVPIDDTYGGFLLGTFFSLILYGLVLHQTYRYVRMHSQDYMYIRVLLVFSLILETLQCVFAMHASYFWLVTNYFTTSELDLQLWSFNLVPAMGGVTMVSTNLFFVRGVWLIGESFRFEAILALIFLAVEMAFSLAITIRLFHSTSSPSSFFLSTFTSQEGNLIHGQFAGATAAHVAITATLLYVLHRGQANSKEPKTILNMFMIYAINTGLLSSICDVISWILAFTLPGTAWWASFQLIAVRLYMITFLAVLNSRKPLNKSGGGLDTLWSNSTTERNFMSRSQRAATAERYHSPQLSDRNQTRIDIKVTTEVEGEGDAYASQGSVLEEGKVLGM